MCLLEENKGGNGKDDRVLMGMVAVQPTTGDIIYDAFEDTFMRNELETRLLHIEPNELLLSFDTSKPTEKVVKHLSFGGGDDDSIVRLERMSEHDTLCKDGDEALNFVTHFYDSNTTMIKQLSPIV
ncbi:hypothetical protein ABG067_008476, partial [Albugo candida]